MNFQPFEDDKDDRARCWAIPTGLEVLVSQGQNQRNRGWNVWNILKWSYWSPCIQWKILLVLSIHFADLAIHSIPLPIPPHSPPHHLRTLLDPKRSIESWRWRWRTGSHRAFSARQGRQGRQAGDGFGKEVGVSINGGTPKSSISIGFPL